MRRAEPYSEIIPARAHWSRFIGKGETLRIVDTHGLAAFS